MAIYALGEYVPVIDPSAFIHPEAVVIGEVTIGAESSVWPGAVLRGDDGPIAVGRRTSVQDGVIVHTDPDTPTVVGDECVIGHAAHLEGCRIENGALIGSGAIVLHRAVVSTGAIVGANAVVLNDMFVPPGALAIGVPAKIREGAADQALITHGVQQYLGRVARYRREMRRID
jgi:carbonic anhydrase/acetyltransferase-like protein (isoleucine patch superfamily)